jgi:hypothetical protein
MAAKMPLPCTGVLALYLACFDHHFYIPTTKALTAIHTVVNMGIGSKIFSVILRFGELCSSVIVVALLGRFFYLAPKDSTEGRLIYTQVISCLELLSSIILIVPLAYSFYAWPLDAILFICSMVAFGLMADVCVG